MSEEVPKAKPRRSLPEWGGRTVTAVRHPDGTLEWTTLRHRKGAADAVDTHALALAPPAEGAEGSAPELKAALAGVAGELTFALPASQALLRVVELPSTDPDELKGMIELQVDRFSPFPVEHLVVSHEVLGVRDSVSRVLIAAVQRTVVEAAADEYRAAGLLPRRADLDLLGWWETLQGRPELTEPGRTIHIRLDPGETTIVVTQDGLPLLCRCLGRGAGAPEAESDEELVEELNFTLTTLETEWGTAAGARAVVWDAGGRGEAFARHLQETCRLTATAARQEDLAPLTEGLARRALRADATMANLAPPEWEQTRRARLATRRLLFAGGAVLAVWLLVVVGFLAALQVRQLSLNHLKTRVEAAEKPASEVRQVQARVRTLEEYSDRRHSALEVLRVVTSAMPPEGLTLGSFIYKKGKSLNLRGDGSSADSIYDFIGALGRFAGRTPTNLFSTVTSEGVSSKKTPAGQVRSEFKLNCVLPGGETP